MSKKITNLSENLKNMLGEEFKDDKTKKPVPLRRELVNLLFMLKEDIDGATILRIYNKVGPMILAGKHTIELEDADYELVKKAIDAHEAQAFIKAQYLMCLEENQPKEEKKEDDTAKADK